MHERHGMVSLWLGRLASKARLQAYLEELYFDDEAHRSEFAEEFLLDDYDDYRIEARYAEDGEIGALLADLSHAAAFVEPAKKRAETLALERPNVALAIYDFDFDPKVLDRAPRKKRRLTFVGAFRYEDGARYL